VVWPCPASRDSAVRLQRTRVHAVFAGGACQQIGEAGLDVPARGADGIHAARAFGQNVVERGFYPLHCAAHALGRIDDRDRLLLRGMGTRQIAERAEDADAGRRRSAVRRRMPGPV
jgi:hypothetical protein